ncbi:MAG: hypothetical protein ACLT8Y_02485 [Dorea formicigenerans]
MTQKNVADCIHVSRSAIAGYEKKAASLLMKS